MSIANVPAPPTQTRRLFGLAPLNPFRAESPFGDDFVTPNVWPLFSTYDVKKEVYTTQSCDICRVIIDE